jgi:hypothetical protein
MNKLFVFLVHISSKYYMQKYITIYSYFIKEDLEYFVAKLNIKSAMLNGLLCLIGTITLFSNIIIGILFLFITYIRIIKDFDKFKMEQNLKKLDFYIEILDGYSKSNNLDYVLFNSFEKSELNQYLKLNIESNEFWDLKLVLDKSEIFSTKIIKSELKKLLWDRLDIYQKRIIKKGDKINESLVMPSILYMLSMMVYIVLPLILNL